MWDAVADLVFGWTCAGCERPGRGLCQDCRWLLANPTPYSTCPDPVPAGLPPTTAAGAYADQLRGVILAHKERARYALARPLGEALAVTIRASGAADSGTVWVCPVPSSRATVRQRGHDPLGRLTRAAVRRLRRDGVAARFAPALRVVRRPRDQAGLSAAERAVNLAGAFAARSRWAEPLTDQPVLLADDVLTTGSTLAEAARALETAGIRVHGCAVLAATRRSPGRRS